MGMSPLCAGDAQTGSVVGGAIKTSPGHPQAVT